MHFGFHRKDTGLIKFAVLLQLLDREPRKKKEALLKIEKHIDIFLERYEFV